MRRLVLAVTVAAAAAVATAARADEAAVREARRVIEEEVRYDRGQELLLEALRAGDNGPDELAAIYELAGVTAVVLGQREAGEQYFRRLLALRPHAALPADTAPKLLEPFTAAQSHMAAAGSLRAVARAPSPQVIAVEVVADPLGMVAAVHVRHRARDGAAAIARGEAGALRVAVPAGARVEGVIVADEYGNRLLELPPPPPPGDGLTPAPPPAAGRRTVLLRWPTWAIAAGVTGAGGLGFALDGQRAHDRLDQILADPSRHFFADAEAARRRWQRDTTIANVAFVTAGVLAAGAVTLAVLGADGAAPWRRRRRAGDRRALAGRGRRPRRHRRLA
ncbi:MAG: hypothetical protein HS111_26650 [Kofleriaceae bacterium]|nr:hypothetical protein [Kofleriaceae bacterium]